MRAKRSKKYRKIMQQYALTFGFREPYQVLVDSHHLRTLHAFKMPLERSLENTLHGKVKPFITRCTLAAVLGTTDLHTSSRPEFLPPPTEVPLRHCSHPGLEGEGGVLSEEACLLDLLGGGARGNQVRRNKWHYVLATAEAGRGMDRAPEDIRPYVREIPGVPIIYVKRSVMVLEELSGASLGVRRREEKDKFREGLIGVGGRKRKKDEDEGGEDDEEGSGNEEKETGVADAAAAKKKKTKKVRGPNPLSVLKKKPKVKVQQPRAPADASPSSVSTKVNGATTGTAQPKAKRRRKHHKRRDSGDDGQDGDQHDKSEARATISVAEEG